MTERFTVTYHVRSDPAAIESRAWAIAVEQSVEMPLAAIDEPEVLFNTAMPNYFETIGIPLLKGRLFGNQDQANTPAVVVINQTMAQRFWPDQDPLGKQIRLAQDGSVATIVGVVGDVRS